jgi:eukaryotic-like serine/threonine-protein kinase
MPEWMIPRYTGRRVLGSGGFGDVVLAREDNSGIVVAVKYLRDDLLADPGFAAMFRAEG